jgi:hypothetical protein
MKNLMNTSTMVVILLIASSFLMACNFANKKEDGLLPVEHGEERQLMMHEEGQTHEDMQSAMQTEDWSSYKNESEIRLQNNETLIAELRSTDQKPENYSDTKFDKMLADLEFRNKECQNKMANYTYSTDSHLAEFKSEFNQDLDDLSTALSNLSVDDKD